MIYETFVCSCSDAIEYGFTFKEFEGDEDCLFDMVLGKVSSDKGGEFFKAEWEASEWKAKEVINKQK